MELELYDGLLVGLLRIVGLLILRARWGAGGEGEVAPTAAQKPLSVGLGSVWMGLTRSRGHHRSHATKERGCGRGRRANGPYFDTLVCQPLGAAFGAPCASEVDAQSNRDPRSLASAYGTVGSRWCGQLSAEVGAATAQTSRIRGGNTAGC